MTLSTITCAAVVSGIMISLARGADDGGSPTLRQAADGRLLIGAAVMSDDLENPQLAELIASQFNCFTGENEFKPSSVQIEPGKFNFEAADKVIDFAKKHDITVVGHTLCWHQQSPKWLFADSSGNPLPREQALKNLKDHIDAVAGHFKGKVIGWDVVNEAISDKPDEFLRDTPARKAIGDDYIQKAFEFAHAADPDAQLYYNDYSNEEHGKRDKCIKLIKSLKSKGVRIDGIGMQSHCLIKSPAPQLIDEAIRAYGALGVKVMITELDVDVLPRKTAGAEVSATEKGGQDPYKNGLPDDVQKELAKRYGELFKVFLKYPNVVTRVTIWGVYDGHTWLNNWPTRGRTNYPMLFDRDMKPKPAFDAVFDAFKTSAK